MPKKLPAIVAPVFAGDCAALTDFLSTFPGDPGNRESWQARLRWWWDDNPAFSDDMIRGWTLLDAGKIVGFMGSIPVRFVAGGRETIAFAGTTWRVLPEYRGQSVALKQQQMRDRKGTIQFATTPTPTVAALLKLFGSQEITPWQGGSMQSVVVLDFRKLLARKFGAGLARHFAACASAPFAALFQSLLVRGLRASKSLTVREIAHADETFDELWQRTREVYANTNVRGSRELNWYCSSSLGGQKTLLGCYAGDALVGYLILLAEQEPGVKLARCVDLWIDPTRHPLATIRALVRQAVDSARSRHLDLAIFPHFSHPLADHYRALGLPQRPAWHRREFIAGPPELLSAMTPENTCLVGAQGDQGL